MVHRSLYMSIDLSLPPWWFWEEIQIPPAAKDVVSNTNISRSWSWWEYRTSIECYCYCIHNPDFRDPGSSPDLPYKDEDCHRSRWLADTYSCGKPILHEHHRWCRWETDVRMLDPVLGCYCHRSVPGSTWFLWSAHRKIGWTSLHGVQ